MADPAAAAARPLERDRDVTELAGEAVRAVQELAGGDDRAADARRDRQVDEVVLALRRTEGVLAERRDVRVPIEERRQAELVAQRGRQRDVAEVRAEVGRLDDDTRPGIERPG